MRLHQAFALAGISMIILSQSAAASLTLGTDLFFSGTLRSSNDLGLSTHNYLFFNLEDRKGISLGPVVNYEPLHSYVTDMTYGAGVRFEHVFFFEFDLGLFRRSYEDVSGTGFAAGMLIGYSFTKVFSISLPVTLKRIQTGLDPRFMLDTFPYLGFRLEI